MHTKRILIGSLALCLAIGLSIILYFSLAKYGKDKDKKQKTDDGKDEVKDDLTIGEPIRKDLAAPKEPKPADKDPFTPKGPKPAGVKSPVDLGKPSEGVEPSGDISEGIEGELPEDPFGAEDPVDIRIFEDESMDEKILVGHFDFIHELSISPKNESLYAIKDSEFLKYGELNQEFRESVEMLLVHLEYIVRDEAYKKDLDSFKMRMEIRSVHISQNYANFMKEVLKMPTGKLQEAFTINGTVKEFIKSPRFLLPAAELSDKDKSTLTILMDEVKSEGLENYSRQELIDRETVKSLILAPMVVFRDAYEGCILLGQQLKLTEETVKELELIIDDLYMRGITTADQLGIDFAEFYRMAEISASMTELATKAMEEPDIADLVDHMTIVEGFKQSPNFSKDVFELQLQNLEIARFIICRKAIELNYVNMKKILAKIQLEKSHFANTQEQIDKMNSMLMEKYKVAKEDHPEQQKSFEQIKREIAESIRKMYLIGKLYQKPDIVKTTEYATFLKVLDDLIGVQKEIEQEALETISVIESNKDTSEEQKELARKTPERTRDQALAAQKEMNKGIDRVKKFLVRAIALVANTIRYENGEDEFLSILSEYTAVQTQLKGLEDIISMIKQTYTYKISIDPSYSPFEEDFETNANLYLTNLLNVEGEQVATDIQLLMSGKLSQDQLLKGTEQLGDFKKEVSQGLLESQDPEDDPNVVGESTVADPKPPVTESQEDKT